LRFTAGDRVFEWVHGWGALPEGMQLGNTHGCIVVDSKDRVYLNTGHGERRRGLRGRTGASCALSARSWPAGCTAWRSCARRARQFLLLAHIGRHQVMKCTLEGEILWTLDYPKESGIYVDTKDHTAAEQYKPTSVAPLPDGGFLVADGYGASWIHRYDSAAQPT
jgi:hypothetical protein